MNIDHLNKAQRRELVNTWHAGTKEAALLLLTAWKVTGCGTCTSVQTLSHWMTYWETMGQLPKPTRT